MTVILHRISTMYKNSLLQVECRNTVGCPLDITYKLWNLSRKVGSAILFKFSYRYTSHKSLLRNLICYKDGTASGSLSKDNVALANVTEWHKFSSPVEEVTKRNRKASVYIWTSHKYLTRPRQDIFLLVLIITKVPPTVYLSINMTNCGMLRIKLCVTRVRRKPGII